MNSVSGRLYKVEHVLLRHKLALMRKREISQNKGGDGSATKRHDGVSTDKFRRLMHEIALILAVEVTRDLPIDGPKPVIVTVLRGGLGMTEAMLELLPGARVGHIGLHRDDKRKKIVQYLVALPDVEYRTCLIVDPVIGTGNVASRAISILKEEGADARFIRYLTIVAAPQGLEKIRKEHPEVNVYFAEQASGLDENSHVVPSWGDASNKLFGIKLPEEERV